MQLVARPIRGLYMKYLNRVLEVMINEPLIAVAVKLLPCQECPGKV